MSRNSFPLKNIWLLFVNLWTHSHGKWTKWKRNSCNLLCSNVILVLLALAIMWWFQSITHFIIIIISSTYFYWSPLVEPLMDCMISHYRLILYASHFKKETKNKMTLRDLNLLRAGSVRCYPLDYGGEKARSLEDQKWQETIFFHQFLSNWQIVLIIALIMCYLHPTAYASVSCVNRSP